jgi:membrane-bound ClpP family serine protease
VDDERPAPAAPQESPLAQETTAVQGRADWRSSIEATLLATILIGIWLIISSFVLSYDKAGAPLVWGIVVIVLALLRLIAAARSATLAIATIAAGVFIVITAFALGDTAGPTANMALMGLAVVVLQVISIAALSERRRISRS